MSRPISLFLVTIIAFLDVASPYSCVRRNTNKYRNEPKLTYYIDVEDENSDFWYRRTVSIILKDKDVTIEEPNILDIFKDFPEDKYEVIGWEKFVGYDDDGEIITKEISFPLELKNEEFFGYWRGIRNCVVIQPILVEID